MSKWLIAPPGTPVDGPGWHEPSPGQMLTWSINNEYPDVAVKRDGVLISTGTGFPAPVAIKQQKAEMLGAALTSLAALLHKAEVAQDVLNLAVEPGPVVPVTIAQQSAEAKKLGGLHTTGPPKKVATPKGEAQFKVPIGSLIIAHAHKPVPAPHAPAPAAVAEKAQDAAQAAKDKAGEAQYQKEHAASLAEKAQDAVQAGTHHWVQAGEHSFAVHNGLKVHVPKNTDFHDEAAVKNAPKVVVKHGDNPEHVMLSPTGGAGQAMAHNEHSEDAIAKNWKELPQQPVKKAVQVHGKHAAWVPHDWKVYTKPGPEAQVHGKFAQDPDGTWHLIDPNGITPVAGSQQAVVGSFAKSGKIIPDEHPGPEPEHVAPSQGTPGAEPVKTEIGGVAVTKEEIQAAIQKLQGSASTQIKGLLKDHPLSESDYSTVYKEELAKFPELAVSPGTKKAHVGQAKLAFIHALTGALDKMATSEAEKDALQAAAVQAEAQAAHAQELTPHQHVMGEVPKAEPTAAKPSVTAKTKPQNVPIPVAVGNMPATEQEIKDAIQILQAAGGTAVKQPLQKAGNVLWQMDYHKINKQELAAHPEVKVQPGSKQAHAGQVKTSVLHYLEGKLADFKTGGVEAGKDDVQQAIDIIETMPAGQGWGVIQQKLKAEGSKLADLDFVGIIKQFQKEHPNTTAGVTAQGIILAWLKSHHGDMAKADQETGHDQAAELDQLVAVGHVKANWNQSAAGAVAAALVQASEIGTPVYAFLSDHTPGEWVIKANWPPNTKASMKATPEHKVFMHFPQGADHEWNQGLVLDTLKEWITPSGGVKPSEQQPEPEKAPEPPPKPSALVPPDKWKQEPEWQQIHDTLTAAKPDDLSKNPQATDAWLANYLWATSKLGKDKYLVAQETGGGWKGEDIPPAAGTWGAQTVAGFYRITPDHQVIHTDKEGNELAFPAEQVLGILTAQLKQPEPEKPGGFDVTAGGSVYHAPAGSEVYVQPEHPDLTPGSGHADVKYVKLPDGGWVYVQIAAPGLTPVKEAPSYLAGTFNEELAQGKLVPWPPGKLPQAAAEGVPVTIAGQLKYTAPAGTSVWHMSHQNLADPETKAYLKYPDGTWHVIWSAMAEPKVSASSTATLDGFIPKGLLLPDNDVAQQVVKTAALPKIDAEKPPEPVPPPDAVQAPPDVTFSVGAKQFSVPYGSKVYWYSKNMGGVSEAVASKYVKYADGHWDVFSLTSGQQKGSPSGYDSYVASGSFSEVAVGAGAPATAEAAKPEPKIVQPPAPVPGGEPVPVIFKHKVVGEVPAGSKLYQPKKGQYNSDTVLYALAPDGTWYSATGAGVSEMSTTYSTPAADKIEEIPVPSAADVEHAKEIAAIQKLFADGAVTKDDVNKDWFAFAAYMLTSKGSSYMPAALNVYKMASGTFTYSTAVPHLLEHWALDAKAITATHVLKDGTTEEIPFEQLKAGLEQYVQPNSVLLGFKTVKHGFWYNPKGKAYLEIKPSGNSGAYYPQKKATYLWHAVNGSVKQVSYSFAIAQLEKNTEWHAQPKDFGPPKLGKAVQYATTAQPGTYGVWSDAEGAGGPEALDLQADGSGVLKAPMVGTGAAYPVVTSVPLPETTVTAMLKGGSLVDTYGTTVVQPGIQPDHYHVFGSQAKTKGELETARDQLQQNTEAYWQEPFYALLGGKSEFMKLKAFQQKFWNEKGYSGGQDQRLKLVALLNELLLVPEAQALAVATTEPKFLKGLPEGINTSAQVFSWTDTGYAKPLPSGVDLAQLGATSKPVLVSKIKDISAEFGGGKVVGTHVSSLTVGELLSWLQAWKKGDMQTVFALDAAGGKVSPVHPGAPGNTATHHISWAPWDPGQIPAGKEIEGTWTPLDVTPSLAEVQNYLIKVNVQHAAYLAAYDWRKLVKAHRQHDQDIVDQLSKKAADAYTSGAQPLSQPPVWADNVQPAKSYDVFLEDGKAVQQWSQQAIQDYVAGHVTELTPFVQQAAVQAGYDAADAAIWLTPGYAGGVPSKVKAAIQAYLDDVKEKEEAEKLRPKWELVPGDPNRVQDQFGHVLLWHAGTKNELSRKVAVASLARAWGFRLPLSQHAFLESDKTPGVVTPEVQPLGTLADLAPGDVAALTERELADIAREHILDYALANHGSTPGSFLRMADGSVIAASKEDAFGDLTWAGADRTGMNDWAKQPVSLIFDAIGNGQLPKTLADHAYVAAVQAARRMQGLSDDRMLKALKSTALPAADIEALLGRKAALAQDIQGLWDSVYQKAGWTPPEVPEAKLSHGLHSGFSEPEFLSHVMGAKAFGVPAFFAGGDLAGGHVHVWTEIDGHDQRQLRGEVVVRGQSLDALVGWVNAHTGEAASMIPKGETEFHGHILEAAKVISDHATTQWGPITQAAYDKFKETVATLQQRLAAAENALVKGAGSAEYAQVAKEYGDPSSVVSMAKFYLQQAEKVEYAKDSHGTFAAASEFPGWQAAEHSSVLVGGVKVTYKKATRDLGTDASHVTADTWQLGKDDGELHLKSGLSTEYQGYVWRVELPTGEVIDVNDEAKSSTPKAHHGRVRFRAVAENGSASLENIRSFLQETGMPMDEATQPDMELLYWRMAAFVLADRADRKQEQPMQVWKSAAQSAGLGGLKGLPYIGKVPEEIAAKHLPADEENALWRKAFANLASEQQIQQFVENHGYLPHLGHYDIRNPEMLSGKPDWYRFDLAPEKVAGKQFLVQSFSNGETDAVLVARTGGLFSGEARLRALGTYKPGMSWGSDQGTGGSGQVFLRQNLSGHSQYSAWVSPRVLARLQTYTFPGDEFGNVEHRRVSSYWDFATATKHTGGSNEAMVADAVSLIDDVEVLKAYSETQRQKIIKDLKDAGITMLRGLPVEDRIVTASGVTEALAKAKEKAKQLAPSWFTHQAQEYTGATEAQVQAADSGQAAAAQAAGLPAPVPPVPLSVYEPELIPSKIPAGTYSAGITMPAVSWNTAAGANNSGFGDAVKFPVSVMVNLTDEQAKQFGALFSLKETGEPGA